MKMPSKLHALHQTGHLPFHEQCLQVNIFGLLEPDFTELFIVSASSYTGHWLSHFHAVSGPLIAIWGGDQSWTAHMCGPHSRVMKAVKSSQVLVNQWQPQFVSSFENHLVQPSQPSADSAEGIVFLCTFILHLIVPALLFFLSGKRLDKLCQSGFTIHMLWRHKP